jgi:hypothetical protein
MQSNIFWMCQTTTTVVGTSLRITGSACRGTMTIGKLPAESSFYDIA